MKRAGFAPALFATFVDVLDVLPCPRVHPNPRFARLKSPCVLALVLALKEGCKQ